VNMHIHAGRKYDNQLAMLPLTFWPWG